MVSAANPKHLMHLKKRLSSETFPEVTSSCWRQYAERAISPIQVESLEDGVEDAVHGLHVDETGYRTSTAAHFRKAAFVDVGGTQPAPPMFGHNGEDEPLGQVALRLPYNRVIRGAPPRQKVRAAVVAWRLSLAR